MPNPSAIRGQALLSAVLGASSLVLLAFTGIPAMLLGLRAFQAINRSDGAIGGRGFALAGMVLGAVGTLECALGATAITLMQLRDTGGKTVCANNLRRIGHVLNLYHDVHERFPAGTVPNPSLPPEQRWSWQAGLLTFLDTGKPQGVSLPAAWQDAAKGINLERGWSDPDSRPAVNKQLASFVCPSYREYPGEGEPGLTTYPGVAGIGADAATLPLDNPRAGAFGYDRQLKRIDAEAGISHVIMVAETTRDVGPWAAGGPSTVRGVVLDQGPVIGVDCPWGGLHVGGLSALMIDGTAVFLSDTIDPKVFSELVRLHRSRVEAGEEKKP